mmetsp:Transcript_60426/g.126476  ORF Transcript_60426/g.126476 Transcript_60426/m.126476 type:complete len:263 (-) Transcript_60426:743-1531(-)
MALTLSRCRPTLFLSSAPFSILSLIASASFCAADRASSTLPNCSRSWKAFVICRASWPLSSSCSAACCARTCAKRSNFSACKAMSCTFHVGSQHCRKMKSPSRSTTSRCAPAFPTQRLPMTRSASALMTRSADSRYANRASKGALARMSSFCLWSSAALARDWRECMKRSGEDSPVTSCRISCSSRCRDTLSTATDIGPESADDTWVWSEERPVARPTRGCVASQPSRMLGPFGETQAQGRPNLRLRYLPTPSICLLASADE